jgi:hypothetical protein
MTSYECNREVELLDEIGNGHWPDAADSELRSHVESCASCSEAAVVASALLEDRVQGEHEVSVRPSGAAWFRIQMRMQSDARVAAARTVRRVHATLVACTFAALVAGLAATSLLGKMWSWFAGAVADTSILSSLPAASPTLLLIAIIPIAALAPVALYLAIAKQ